jgi:hypothetical protein
VFSLSHSSSNFCFALSCLQSCPRAAEPVLIARHHLCLVGIQRSTKPSNIKIPPACLRSALSFALNKQRRQKLLHTECFIPRSFVPIYRLLIQRWNIYLCPLLLNRVEIYISMVVVVLQEEFLCCFEFTLSN